MSTLLPAQSLPPTDPLDRIRKATSASRLDAEIEASDRQIHPTAEVVEDREKGGWVWKKVDGAKKDLATDDRRVAAW